MNQIASKEAKVGVLLVGASVASLQFFANGSCQ